MRIFDPTLELLGRALDARMDRQAILAGNLANADTPGFVPGDLDVAARMAAPPGSSPAPGASSPGHLSLEGSLPAAPLPAPGAALGGPDGAGPGADGNGVDIDRTLVALAENALHYNAAARTAGKKLAILRYVASDGAA